MDIDGIWVEELLPAAEYTFDGDGNLVKSEVNGVVTYYLGKYYEKTVQNGHYAETCAECFFSKKHYSAGSSIIAVRTVIDGTQDTLNWLVGDHLGSTSLVTDSAGVVVSEVRYSAFGEMRYLNGETVTDLLFTSQRFEGELGIYNYGARWYDPALGRFIQADSLIPDSTNPKAYDHYAYVNNNPLIYTDPDGHCPLLIGAAIGALIGGAIAGAAYALTNQGESFEWGEFAIAAGGGAVAGALVGSGIGLVAGAVSTATAAGATMAATAEAVTAVSAMSTSLISAGTSAEIAGLTYMAQTPGGFEASPYIIGSTVSGIVGYLSPNASFGAKVGLNVVGAELTYAATTEKLTLQNAVSVGIGGAAAGVFDYGVDNLFIPTMDEFFRMYPSSVSRATGAAADGFASNFAGYIASWNAQKIALEAK